jgi:DNA (cytosine-5)-methyltransferase 1
MMSFKFIDLFAGIGGFHIALSDLGGTCVFASEIDEDAQGIYRKNFQHEMKGPIVGDIIPLTEKTVSKLIPEHDVLAAGFPCQPFSKSGAQLGMDETRGTLFYNIAKILEKRKPRIIILENVRNLTGPKHKHTWALILRVLRDLGYHVSDSPTIISPHLIPPANGGTPQARDRVYIIGVLVGKQKAWKLADEPFVFDRDNLNGWKPTNWNLSQHLLQDDQEIEFLKSYKVSKERLEVIKIWQDFVDSVGARKGKRLPGFPLWEFSMSEKPKLTIDMPDWKIDFLKKNSAFYVENKKEIDAWRKRHKEILLLNNSYRKFEWQAQDMKSIWDGVIQFRPSGVRVKKADYLPALVAMNQTSIIGKKKRTITVREAARLQAFPENFSFFDQNPAKSFKQLGNAVSVGTVKFVLSSILEDLKVKL